MAAIRELEVLAGSRGFLAVVPPREENTESAKVDGPGDAEAQETRDPAGEKRNNFGMTRAERQLVEKATAGDVESFGEIYVGYFPKVKRYVYYKIGDEAEAEDITSRVFLNAFAHISKYKLRSPFSTWLFTIAHNLVVNHYRDASKHSHFSLDDSRLSTENRGEFWYDLNSLDISVNVRAALMTLSEDNRRAVALRYFYGMKFEEIGRMMGRTSRAAKALVFRSRKKMRKFMADQVEELL